MINKECLDSSPTLYYPGEQLFFYLSGSRLAMEKLDLHFLNRTDEPVFK